ncbi:MAG TPA: protein kinase, partial [Burkholderiaceae bacterium]|nr:protein kinase [Burkholderiaceae bacterium]
MPPPQRLGKYQILRKLGAGAMGIVYEGFDPLIERSVALKVIRQDDFSAAGSGELRARLKREAQAAGRLTHPGIVAVYEYGEDAGGEGAFIAMEMVRGRELATVLDEGERFAPEEAVRVMRAV